MGFEFQLDQTMTLLFAASLLSMQHHGVGAKTGRLGIKIVCQRVVTGRCFSAKHAASRSRSQDWSARNQDSVSEGSDRSTHGLLFLEASTIKTQLSIFV
jgi:hypothetical protein